ncbi:MAG: ATP-binding protein [Desulfurococcales archaeon]|nr:ATP-binding protein [Desulfurococcales archaeon]
MSSGQDSSSATPLSRHLQIWTAHYKKYISKSIFLAECLGADIHVVTSVVADEGGASTTPPLPPKIIGLVSAEESIQDDVPVLIPRDVWVTLLPVYHYIGSTGYPLVAIDPKTYSIVLLQVETAQLTPQTVALRGGFTHLEVGDSLRHADSNLTPIRLVTRPAARIKLDSNFVESLPDQCDHVLHDRIRRAIESVEPEAPGIPPDPWSPVIIPQHWLILHILLTVKDEGLTLGALGVLDLPLILPDGIMPGLEIPWSVMKKHILITGTTGSGKTSLVKNLLTNAVWRKKYKPEFWRKTEILVLDASGDYAVIALPGKVTRKSRRIAELYIPYRGSGTTIPALIAVPVSNTPNNGSFILELENYAKRLVSSYRYSNVPCQIEQVRPMVLPGAPAHIMVMGRCGNRRFRFGVVALGIIPKKLKLQELLRDDPFLTKRARDTVLVIDDILDRGNYLQNCQINDAKNLIDVAIRALKAALNSTRNATCPNTSGCTRNLCNEIRQVGHHQTLNNLLQRLIFLSTTGLVEIHGDPRMGLNYKTLMGLAAKLDLDAVVIDLSYTSAVGSVDEERLKVLIGSGILRSLAESKLGSTGHTLSKTILIIDEAHLYFPRETQERDWLVEIASKIRRVARLGRSRGISIIFATHRVQDVDRLIQTLANTKIYLRTDYASVRDLHMPEHYKRRLPSYRDHAAVIDSYYIRGGFIGIVGSDAIPGHKVG